MTLFRKSAAAVLAVLLLLPSWVGAAAPQAAGRGESPAPASSRIAVVIDDFGNRMKGTDEMFKLPVPVTAAVMPFMPTSREDAERAHQLGLDVIVHMPMEPKQGNPKWLGPGAIRASMSDAEVRQAVEKAIAEVPHAVGMNNHMGSKITADERIMRVVLAVCKEKGLFFLDSRTAYKTVIPRVGAELGVPVLGNDLFLDDVYTASFVSGQIVKLKKLAREQSDCITIGHVGAPGLITAAAVRSAAASMPQSRFVRLTELLPASAKEKLVLPHA
ncbi:divergent polysaccharide deacetylase family protein [Paenibacillus albicereus]|uniref:Divergent polysaccharide deacetylase family protein n=1 Tax=Paenibacillus albicereus TaxID=2726185 RepID=A0A6H2GX32_9BACL|nr:divergent polysaccharide deacetylase family protein [Paenibacillus albicereus]QJC51698.1 divergent polysaccharide deacetylase family protein [Paenibacillus albicereus]